MLSLLPKLAPVAVRHLAAYVDLAVADAAIAVEGLRRRLIAAVIGALAAVFALLIGCAWLLAAAWDTPWRNGAFGVLLFLFVAAAAAGLARATGKEAAEAQPFARLKAEWEQDQQLIHDMSAQVEASEPAAHGQ